MGFLKASLVSALLAATAAPAQPPDAGWETYLFIRQLSPDFATRPEAATMSDPFAGWGIWPGAPELPPDLRRRVFVNESYLLLDIDPIGRAAGCRPLRASAQPRLDAASCELLMRPGFFSAYLLPPDPPRPAMQWVIGARWQRVDPETARRNAAKPLPTIAPAPAQPSQRKQR